MNKIMLEHWENKINVVNECRGGMTNEAKDTLARVLTNMESANDDLRTINESVCRSVPSSNISGIDWFPEHAIDMVSAIYASQIIDDLVSVQAIDSPIGVIRFLQYVYGQDRGSVKRNEVAIDEWGAMRGVDNGHFVACEWVKDESFATATAGKAEAHLQRLPIKADAGAYIDFTVDGTNTFRALKNANGWELKHVDANGYMDNQGVGANDAVSVDPESGFVKLTLASLQAGESVAASYFQDLAYCPTDSMNLELRLKTEMIKAVPHKIRANFSFDASYALSKAHGINIEESLVNACTATIRQERDNEIINILMKQAAFKSTWSRKITSYISQHEHDLSFISEIFACASKINFETKRGFGNWVVVGRQGLNILRSAGTDHFKSGGATLANNGAFVVGMLEDQIKVIYSPYIPEDAYLVGYKGSDTDAGFVVADFLPITKSDLVMLDDFVGRQGLISYYGTKMINNKMYVVGKIIDGEMASGSLEPNI